MAKAEVHQTLSTTCLLTKNHSSTYKEPLPHLQRTTPPLTKNHSPTCLELLPHLQRTTPPLTKNHSTTYKEPLHHLQRSMSSLILSQRATILFCVSFSIVLSCAIRFCSSGICVPGSISAIISFSTAMFVRITSSSDKVLATCVSLMARPGGG